MKCDICKKKEATVHVTEIINDEMTELHLCEECAKKKSFQMDKHFGLADLLAGLSDFESPLEGVKKDEAKKERLKCSNCGLTYEDFRKIGRLGCSECYSTFKDNLAPLLKRIHKATQHIGSAPLKKASQKSEKTESSQEESEIEKLKKEMQKAVEKEAFEKAAKIRDKIKGLKEKGKTQQKEKEDNNKEGE